ncbi:MAG: hypothetical protein RBT66_01100 [bacterium]|jgi:hypothetical protein|nr:hypothetical protein [bacterium]
MNIEVEGAEQLIAKLTTVQQFNKVKAAVSQEGTMLAGKLKHYPRKVPTPNPLIKANDRVRRGFFWHLKHGNINTPYRRSGDLRKHWTRWTGDGGMSTTISNYIGYAPLVQGDNQTYGHGRSGWLTIEAAEKKYGAGIKRRIMKAIEEELRNV